MLNTLSDPLVVDVALVDDGWSVGKPGSGMGFDVHYSVQVVL